MKSLIVIDNEVCEVESIHDNYVELDNGNSYHIFETHEDAGEAAKDYYVDLVQNDPEEFRCHVGDENLIQWALGNFAGPGYTKTDSLNDWLDLWLDTPDEHFASYNGIEIEGIICNKNFLYKFFGDLYVDKQYVVMYRHN